MTNKNLSHWTLLLLGMACMVIPFASWLASVVGLPVRSMLSDEGVRWLFMHGMEGAFAFPALHVLMAVPPTCTISWVIAEHGQATGPTSRRRSALLSGLSVLLVGFVILVILALWPQSPLLGLSGGLFPSPFLRGLYAGLCCLFTLCGVIYAMVLKPSARLSMVVTHRMQQIAPWAISALMLNFMWNMIQFIL